MKKAEYKVEGGKLIKIQLKKRNNKIEWIKITGDFFLHPEELIDDIERMLIGQYIEKNRLNNSIAEFIENNGATLLGVSPKDLETCILRADEKNG